MQIKKIHIQNFKSLVDFELDNPKPFCAFVGPNASGKSNIFEALEFVNYFIKFKFEANNIFGGKETILSYSPMVIDRKFNFNNINKSDEQTFSMVFENDLDIAFWIGYGKNDNQMMMNLPKKGSLSLDVLRLGNKEYRNSDIAEIELNNINIQNSLDLFIDNFSRIFVGKPELLRINAKSPKLKTDASNLSQILWQIFQVANKKADFIDWLRILIPEFESIEVKQSNIDDRHEFFVYEKGSTKPFPRRLLSDGTKNILALMAAVYQSSEPQFLCIEEPENGLHPEAIELLVDFFRDKCETERHHIWLNTHSPTLVRCMKIDELVMVNKIDGQTRAKRIENTDGLDISTEEAWLTNTLGGGVSWSK